MHLPADQVPSGEAGGHARGTKAAHQPAPAAREAREGRREQDEEHEEEAHQVRLPRDRRDEVHREEDGRELVGANRAPGEGEEGERRDQREQDRQGRGTGRRRPGALPERHQHPGPLARLLRRHGGPVDRGREPLVRDVADDAAAGELAEEALDVLPVVRHPARRPALHQRRGQEERRQHRRRREAAPPAPHQEPEQEDPRGELDQGGHHEEERRQPAPAPEFREQAAQAERQDEQVHLVQLEVVEHQVEGAHERQRQRPAPAPEPREAPAGDPDRLEAHDADQEQAQGMEPHRGHPQRGDGQHLEDHCREGRVDESPGAGQLLVQRPAIEEIAPRLPEDVEVGAGPLAQLPEGERHGPGHGGGGPGPSPGGRRHDANPTARTSCRRRCM